ncbi:MAG TPA: hypothetical protein DCQ98_14020 [Planctomycetaceae bacterium]|nr:hypothetical protein [Planctomycetaceae bacterium]
MSFRRFVSIRFPVPVRTASSFCRSVPRSLSWLFAIVLTCVAGRTSVADDVTSIDPGDDPKLVRGAEIFRKLCADCHGSQGQGSEHGYADVLAGDDTIGELTRVITETMPEEDPSSCVGEDAEAVAAYIHYAFYSEAARLRNKPPRIELSRLTGNQFRQAISDLYAGFEGPDWKTDERGVKGVYFEGEHWKDDAKKLERTDATLDFDWGEGSPDESIKPDSFYVHWVGGLRVDVTGEYELVVRSTCSFVMDFGRDGRQLIDNHVQSGDKTEFRQRMYLTAGRTYPFKVDFRQRARSTDRPPAKFSFSWIPPGGVEAIVPSSNLIPGWRPPAFALQTVLPPDDRSYGFERGISVSREWDEATTAAALEFAQIAIDELWPAWRRNHKDDSDENRAKLRGFLTDLVRIAYAVAPTDEQRARWIDRVVDATEDDADAIRHVVLLTLKNPRFLYRLADAERSVSARGADRLALVLWDSIPADKRLIEAIDQNRLVDEAQVREAAWWMVEDPRTRAKTRELMYGWLNLSPTQTLTKNSEEFPDFDAALVADLRRSLDALLDDVVWGEERKFGRLFTEDRAFTTERLAAFYGPSWEGIEPVGDGLHRTAPAGESRRGVLTHPLLMSANAYAETSSPIHRGIFLNRFVFGRSLKTPAEAPIPLPPSLHPDLTTRERVELQTAGESCQSCHAKINALGFTLENFDAVGRFRSEERGKTIDASGGYVSLADERATLDGFTGLADYLADSPDARRAFVVRAFQHFVKQPPAAFGPETTDRLVAGFTASGGDIPQLLVEIAVVAASQPVEITQAGVSR